MQNMSKYFYIVKTQDRKEWFRISATDDPRQSRDKQHYKDKLGGLSDEINKWSRSHLGDNHDTKTINSTAQFNIMIKRRDGVHDY